MVNLKAENNNQKIIVEWLNANAGDELTVKINCGKKTMADCWKYIVDQARKQQVSGCACIEDSIVFGWAVQFFGDDTIKASGTNTGNTRPESEKQEKKPAKTAAQTDDNNGQLSFF